ncbi:hypothetical protein C8Q73DRAFT_717529 [Cubamyces lactineus]|nr:hypothetical protein C8Q73DRAFT_717529 [Cubamyces lactineus]
MSGIAYSTLANWDGSLSVSGSQAGGGNTTREPTATPSSVAGSPRPRPRPSSVVRSPAGNVTASTSGSVSRSTLVSAPHASGSSTSAADHSDVYALGMNDRSMAAPSSSYRAADRGRRSEESRVQDACKLAPSRNTARENPPAATASAIVAERYPAASKDAQPNMRRDTSPVQPPASAHNSNAKHADISIRASHNFHPEHFVPHTSKNTTSSSLPSGSTHQNAIRPVQEKWAHSRDVVIEEDTGSLLDADGETDHESAASVYALPKAPNTARPTQRPDATVEPRDSTDTTAVSRSRGTSWERAAQRSKGSYSSEFLEAAQQYYVSRSPSVQILDNPPADRYLPRDGTRSHQQVPHRPSVAHEGRQSTLLDPEHIFSLSPLSTPSPSPVSTRGARGKRRRLERPYVQVPPLPPHRSREAYRPASEIPALKDEPVEMDYADQLRLALHQASLNNAELMDHAISPSTASPERRRLRRITSVSPTKKSTQAPSKSVSTVSKKHGRPLGSRNKPKEPRPEKPRSPSPEPIEFEEPYVHTPADELEPYFPSVRVEIEDRPMPSAALFLVAFRAFFKDQVKHLPHQATARTATLTKVPESRKSKTPIPLPRRSLFRRKQAEAQASTSTSPNPPTATHTQAARSRPPSPALPPSTSPSEPVLPPIEIPLDVDPPPPPPLVSSTSGPSHSTALIGLDMLAEYGSSPPPEEASDSNRTSDNDPSAPRSPAQQTDAFNADPAVLHDVSQDGMMEFQHASQYALAGPSGVADMFAAEKALRDAQGGSYRFHDDASAPPGDLGHDESYFQPIDIDMHFAGAVPDHTWMLEDPPATESQSTHANGTIDPSLLGGAAFGHAPELHADTPSPPETPMAGPSKVQVHPTAMHEPPYASTHTPSVLSSQVVPAHTASTPSTDPGSDEDQPLSAKRKRAQAEQPQLPIRLPCEVEQESTKRPRRLTERALATYYETDTSDDLRPAKKAKGAGNGKGAGKGKGKGTGKGKGKERATSDSSIVEPRSFRELAEELTYCHQCRNKNTYEKMRCTATRDSGEQCRLRFCERCINNRYPEITFNAYAVRFVCPRCQNTCNCTSCSARRGETYISARIGKLPPAGSAEALALAHEVATAKLSHSAKVSCGDGALPPKMDLVGGQYFGVIYGVAGGERMGQGFVGEDNRGIVMRNLRRVPKVVAYIGKPRRRTARPVQSVPPVVETNQPIPVDISVPVEGSIPVLRPPSPSSHLLSNILPNGLEGSSAVAASNVPSPAEAVPDPRQAPSMDIPLPPSPPRKSYIGNRSVLRNSAYVSIDVLVARMELEDAQDRAQELTAPSSDPISVSSTGGDENRPSDGATGPASQPQTEDVQWAIALALHALEVDAVKS